MTFQREFKKVYRRQLFEDALGLKRIGGDVKNNQRSINRFKTNRDGLSETRIIRQHRYVIRSIRRKYFAD